VSGILSAFNSAITMLPFESRMTEFMSFEATKQRFRNAAASAIAHTWRRYCFRKHLQSHGSSGSVSNVARRFVMEQSWIFAMSEFYVARINFRQYNGRFQGDAYLVQCLRGMLRRASLCANLTFGDDREPTHVDNFIVNQMSIILTRDVHLSKDQLEEARVAGLVARQRSLILEQEAEAAEREQREGVMHSDSDDGIDDDDDDNVAATAYQLLRRRIQSRQKLISIASSMNSSTSNARLRRKLSRNWRTRVYTFRFPDAPSALQLRLPDIRAANPSTPPSDNVSDIASHPQQRRISDDSPPSEAWQELVDDQPPALSLKLALNDLRPRSRGAHDDLYFQDTNRSMPTARTPKLFRSGSLRASDVLQYIISTPPVAAQTPPPHDGHDGPRRDYHLSIATSSSSAALAHEPSAKVDDDIGDDIGDDDDVGDDDIDDQQVSSPPALERAPSAQRTARTARRRLTQRQRAPGEHHHHHHLHCDLPPPPPYMPVPHIIESRVRDLPVMACIDAKLGAHLFSIATFSNVYSFTFACTEHVSRL
jgi:hypothetical protein